MKPQEGSNTRSTSCCDSFRNSIWDPAKRVYFEMPRSQRCSCGDGKCPFHMLMLADQEEVPPAQAEGSVWGFLAIPWQLGPRGEMHAVLCCWNCACDADPWKGWWWQNAWEVAEATSLVAKCIKMVQSTARHFAPHWQTTHDQQFVFVEAIWYFPC